MSKDTLLSDDRIRVIRHLAHLCNDVPGHPVEIGVYKGGSLAHIAECFPHKTVFGFDTFKGLPASGHSSREIHEPGDFSDTSREGVTQYLSRVEHVANFQLVEGIFPNSVPANLNQICFAHLDVDFEKSTKECLQWLKKHLHPRGVIVVDDYGWSRCPGVKPAVDSFAESFDIYTPAPSQCWMQLKGT